MTSGLPDTLQQRIRKTRKCWHWTGGTWDGYGIVKWQRKQWRAHRLVYTILVGPIPEGMHLHHRCLNKVCVRPTHLEPKMPSVHAKDHGIGGMGAINAQKEACPRGHPYDSVSYRGDRECSTCKNERGRQYWQRKAERQGRAVGVRNNSKTHCPKGHEYTEENTYVSTKGSRICRVCRREGQRK